MKSYELPRVIRHRTLLITEKRAELTMTISSAPATAPAIAHLLGGTIEASVRRVERHEQKWRAARCAAVCWCLVLVWCCDL